VTANHELQKEKELLAKRIDLEGGRDGDGNPLLNVSFSSCGTTSREQSPWSKKQKLVQKEELQLQADHDHDINCARATSSDSSSTASLRDAASPGGADDPSDEEENSRQGALFYYPDSRNKLKAEEALLSRGIKSMIDGLPTSHGDAIGCTSIAKELAVASSACASSSSCSAAGDENEQSCRIEANSRPAGSGARKKSTPKSGAAPSMTRTLGTSEEVGKNIRKKAAPPTAFTASSSVLNCGATEQRLDLARLKRLIDARGSASGNSTPASASGHRISKGKKSGIKSNLMKPQQAQKQASPSSSRRPERVTVDDIRHRLMQERTVPGTRKPDAPSDLATAPASRAENTRVNALLDVSVFSQLEQSPPPAEQQKIKQESGTTSDRGGGGSKLQHLFQESQNLHDRAVIYDYDEAFTPTLEEDASEVLDGTKGPAVVETLHGDESRVEAATSTSSAVSSSTGRIDALAPTVAENDEQFRSTTSLPPHTMLTTSSVLEHTASCSQLYQSALDLDEAVADGARDATTRNNTAAAATQQTAVVMNASSGSLLDYSQDSEERSVAGEPDEGEEGREDVQDPPLSARIGKKQPFQDGGGVEASQKVVPPADSGGFRLYASPTRLPAVETQPGDPVMDSGSKAFALSPIEPAASEEGGIISGEMLNLDDGDALLNFRLSTESAPDLNFQLYSARLVEGNSSIQGSPILAPSLRPETASQKPPLLGSRPCARDEIENAAADVRGSVSEVLAGKRKQDDKDEQSLKVVTGPSSQEAPTTTTTRGTTEDGARKSEDTIATASGAATLAEDKKSAGATYFSLLAGELLRGDGRRSNKSRSSSAWAAENIRGAVSAFCPREGGGGALSEQPRQQQQQRFRKDYAGHRNSSLYARQPPRFRVCVPQGDV